MKDKLLSRVIINTDEESKEVPKPNEPFITEEVKTQPINKMPSTPFTPEPNNKLPQP